MIILRKKLVSLTCLFCSTPIEKQERLKKINQETEKPKGHNVPRLKAQNKTMGIIPHLPAK
jgi:hypothetical protein